MKYDKICLKELITIKSGKDHKSLKDGKYPVYGSGGIIRYVEKYLYNKESILLPRKGTLNNIQFADKPFWTVDTCYYTEVNTEKVIPYFLFSNLRQFDIEALNTGSAVPSMTFDKYYSIQVALPDLEKQQKIVDILKPYDDLIENNQKQIKLLEEAAQRLYKEWFVDLHFPGYEDVKIVDGVPEGWKITPINMVAKLKAGGDKPKTFSKKMTNENKIPVFANGITEKGLMGFTDKAVISNPSVTISARGTVGVVFLRTEPYVPIVRLISVTPIEDKVDVFYLYLYLVNLNFRSTGAAQQQITVPLLKNKNIVCPTDDVQKSFNYVITPIFNKIENLEKQINKLTQARDRLLPKLMSGEIEV